MKYLFGPVPSRRLGSSLGVDLVPYKVCSFDCIYCQLGRTTDKTLARKEYVPIADVLAEVKDFIDSGQMCDYITLSSSGEPTLNSMMGKLIKEIKNLTNIPVSVLTNASLIGDQIVREELGYADVVLPSLDVFTQEVFERLHRPHSEIKLEKIVEGLMEFTKDFKGEVWVEVMLVKGVNDGQSELTELANTLKKIKPDRIQLNTVVRPPAEEYAKPLTEDRLNEVAGLLEGDVIADFKRRETEAYMGDKEQLIIDLLKRRPCTLTDISSALGFHENEVLKYIETLEKDKVVGEHITGGKRYFKYVGGSF